MTYTATGFSNPVRVIFEAIFKPTTIDDRNELVAEHFRVAIRRERLAVHVMDRLAIRPARDGAMRLAQRLATLHHGRINAYTAYVMVALLVALAVAGIAAV
ncbi:MAG: hypothetical protein JSS46_04605 [Proteobacteria bacterium]|nr:hypothetical protein [Pseudomonadota bacterium]